MATTLAYTTAILGVPFHDVTINEAVRFIEEKIDEGGFHQVATANVDFLMHSLRDKELQNILCSCDLVVPDGMPILWAARLLGTALKERVCGVDLVPSLAALCVERDFSIFLLGASDAISAGAAENLKKRFPGLRIAGRYSPPLQTLERMNHEEILKRIAMAKPDILLVAFGNPKQEKWIAMHRDRLQVPVCIGIGGSLDFISGAIHRSPQWIQKAGFEWLFRVFQEPKRLTKRYLGDAIGLALHMPAQLINTALQPRHKADSSILQEQIGNIEIFSIQGDFTGTLVNEFQELAKTASENGKHLILDLGQTTYLGQDSLGTLIQLSVTARERRHQLWLAEPQPPLRRMIKSAHLDTCFMTAATLDDAVYRTARAAEHDFFQMTSTRKTNCSASQTVRVQFEFPQEICCKITVAKSVVHRQPWLQRSCS